MVTKESLFDRPINIFGLSTDQKPYDVINGSRFIEMDTDKVFLFDADGSEWLEVGGS